MSHRRAVIYHYDGSFEGFLCCIYESYTRRELPLDLLPPELAQPSLYPVRQVDTDTAHAARVFDSLAKKLGPQGEDFVATGFLCGREDKALLLYRFVELGYEIGPRVTSMRRHPAVEPVWQMNRAVRSEAHLMTGFLRFSQYGQALVAIMEPKHFILPLIAPHFCGRFPEEQFLILDRSHCAALIYRPYESRLIPMDNLELPAASQQERLFRSLWQGYYQAISIQSRENPRCRMTHMPKRFWPCMTEFQEKEDAGKLQLPEEDSTSPFSKEVLP